VSGFAQTVEDAQAARSVRRQIDPIPQSPYKELELGPEGNLDEAGAIGAELGSAKKSHLIIRAVANMYPRELVSAASLPVDHFRTAVLDEDELDKLAKPVLLDGQSVVPGSGRVRGRRSEERVVSFLVQSEKGRTGRAILPYEKFTSTEDAWEDAPGFEMVTRDRAEIDRGDDPRAKERKGKGQSKSDRETKRAKAEAEKLAEQVEELQAKLEEEQKAREEAEAKAAAATETAEAATESAQEAAESANAPIPDYENLNAREVKEKVTVESHGREGVEAALAYEREHKNRSGVVSHFEKQLAAEE
jgi:hypothetical protein